MEKIDGNFWKGLGYFGVGAAAGTLSAGVGAGISSALVSGGSFSAGFLGTAAAKTAVTSFISGAAIGGGAGGTGGFITGFGNGLLGGKNFGQSLGQGALYGLGGAVSGALVGGVIGGIDAYRDGRNFMHGGRLIEDVSMPLPQMNQQIGQVENLDCRYEVFRSNDTYYNGNTNSVSDLRNRFPNVETSDATMSKMYGSKRMSLLKLDTSGLSKVEIANEVAANLAKNNSVIYEMRINEKFAHAVAVSRVRKYDNGRILLNFMNPSGAGGYRTNNFNNLRQMFRVLKF